MVIFYSVHKDDGTLAAILDKQQFAGTLVSDNASERQLRSAALARRTGHTSKTPSCAKRQSVLSSVLQSIGKQLKQFNLAGVIDEVKRWTAVRQSCFEDALNSLPDQKTKRDPPRGA